MDEKRKKSYNLAKEGRKTQIRNQTQKRKGNIGIKSLGRGIVKRVGK